MKTSIIIPTYNEAENIKELINKLTDVFNKNNIPANIVVVDDNSPDGTSEIVKEIMKSNDIVRLIQREGKLGLGTAHIKGMKYVLENLNPDLIMTMDADFSHNPDYIPDFLEKIKDGYDVIVGSRYVFGGGTKNWEIYRKVISRGANTLAKLILRLKTKENTSGYRCYTKKVLQTIDLDAIKSDGYSFLMEMAYLCKDFKVGEVPIIFIDREYGTSKISKKEIFKALKTLIRLRLKSVS